MKPEGIILSSLPAIFFLVGMFFLLYSPLSLTAVIDLQYDAVDIFLKELIKNDLRSAIFTSLKYLWDNAIWYTLVFLVLISFGLVVYTYFFDKLDIRVVIVSQIIFVLVSFILLNFSLIVLFISVSLFVGVLWMQKTFEKKKNDFATGYSVISTRLNLLNLFLCVGVFLAILMNLQVYDQKITESNLNLLGSFIPNATDIKNVQKAQIERITDGFKASLNEQYQLLSPDVQSQCSSMYDAMIEGIYTYKEVAFEEIDQQQVEFGGMDILQGIPAVGMMSKVTPIFMVFSIYAYLSMMNTLVGVFGGIVYSVMKKIKREKSRISSKA